MVSRGFGLLILAILLFVSACSSETQQQTEQKWPKVVQNPDPDLEGLPLFEEVAKSAGVEMVYHNGEVVQPPHLSILESLGGGVGLLDYDQDGLLDIYIPGGGYFGGKDNLEIRGHIGKLYRNLGNWKFKDVTKEMGLTSLAGNRPWFYSHAAAVADYDRDGWPDLLVTGWRGIALFHNVSDGKGGRQFKDVSAQAGLDKGITWATSAGWADLDGDGYPDLYVCQYVDWSFANNPKCDYDGKTPDVCPPKKFKGIPDRLYHNNTKGSFVEVGEKAGLRQDGGTNKGLGVILVDVNLDGKPDIYVANDTVENFLYINHSTPGKIILKEGALLAGVALDSGGSANGSMGLDAGDPEGLGKPALWVTNYENELHALYRNQSTKDNVYFLFATPASGIAAIGQKFVGWGTAFIDVDHHGWEDIFIANGHAIRYPTGTTRKQRPVLLRNQNGKFKDISKRAGPYFHQQHLSRGVASGDLDNDGKIDLVISHMNEPISILHNVAEEKNHWLGLDLRGKNHADIVGTRVVLEAGGRKQSRFAKGGGSYASSADRRMIFGLGPAERMDKLTVYWPNGSVQEFTGLALDQYYVIDQGKKKPRGTKAEK